MSEVEDQESGSALRDQLEEALAENKRYKVEKALATNPLVKAEDLQSFKATDDIVMEAERIQRAREDQQRDLLAKAGLTDDQIKQALAGEKVPPPQPDTGPERRIVQTATAGVGSRPKLTRDDDIPEGSAKITEYFRRQGTS